MDVFNCLISLIHKSSCLLLSIKMQLLTCSVDLIWLLIMYHCTFILSGVIDVKHWNILMQNSCIPKFFNQITFSFQKVVDTQIKNTLSTGQTLLRTTTLNQSFKQFYLILHIAINYNYVTILPLPALFFLVILI